MVGPTYRNINLEEREALGFFASYAVDFGPDILSFEFCEGEGVRIDAIHYEDVYGCNTLLDALYDICVEHGIRRIFIADEIDDETFLNLITWGLKETDTYDPYNKCLEYYIDEDECDEVY